MDVGCRPDPPPSGGRARSRPVRIGPSITLCRGAGTIEQGRVSQHGTRSRVMKLGVVGVGWIAKLMTEPARKVSGVDVPACTAARGESAGRFAREHKIERSYESFENMLDDGASTPSIWPPRMASIPQTLLALGAGKHVLVEKPVALSESDAVEMAETADRFGLVLGAGFHLRHNAAIRELKRLLDAGAVGEPRGWCERAGE